MFLKALRENLSPSMKSDLARAFPKIYMHYERKYILNALKLKQFYNKEGDLLRIGRANLPMKVLCNPNLIGSFNAEFDDIVYPMLPGGNTYSRHTYDEGPYQFSHVKIEKDNIVFDCGANIGLFSVMAANNNCLCYAFEPLPKNIDCLRLIISVNPHIFLAPYAVSNVDGRIQFTNNKDSIGTNKISLSEWIIENTISVNAITLDSFVDKNNIERVDFIKADIEGAERYMLMGAKHVLKEFAPKLSICKYHLPDDPQVLRELILDANPRYIIEEHWQKIYAYVPK